ncbi:transposable element Tcb2 transposase [Trichonephila clavipes]|nr:transposable element Tcb2 transposase [Trichonephila clavipes]
MQHYCILRTSGRGHLTLFSVQNKTSKKTLLECAESLTKGRAEVDMPLRRFLRQYELLSKSERGRIIGMIETGWSARRVARQLGQYDCVVRRYCYQWMRKMSFTRRPVSGCP